MHVILFEPEIPPNTGNVIRLCANTGARLHLIRPLGFSLDDRALKRAGLDYHELATMSVHSDFHACLEALGGARLIAVETAGQMVYSDFAFGADDALVFGPETRGLPQPVLQAIGPERVVRIPMSEGNRSLNLSNAVAIVLYEALRQQGWQR